VAVLVLLALMIGFVWWRLYSVEIALRHSVQTLLDLEHQSFLAGDGELFFSVYEDNLAFQSAQLHPQQQAPHAAGWRVSKAELQNNFIWATLTTEVKGIPQQRIAFFEQTERGFRHIATDLNYWGRQQTVSLDWGSLRFFQADAQWAEQFAGTITKSIQKAQLDKSRSFSVVIGRDFQVSALRNTISYPSPQLVGLETNGEPSAEYWRGLESAIAARFEPVIIRYALPSLSLGDGMASLFKRLADQFVAQYPPGKVSIELVLADELGDEAQSWFPTVDAAFLAPTEQLIKQGMIHDLSSFAEQDRSFDSADYYAQAWRSVWWQERLWAVPWSMSVNLLYFDKELFRRHGVAEPTPDWTWQQLSPALTQIDSSVSDDKVFVDGSRDTLFALAYGYDTSCPTSLSVDDGCLPRLSQAGTLAALEWYAQMVVQDQTMADLANLSPGQRLQAMRRSQSAHKQNAIWVDSVVNYEYQLVLQPTGLLPFLPRSPDKSLVMPIHVHSHIMSQYTKNPYWTWQWLKFLSHQPPPPRQIPARPSVANEVEFWERLPTPIAQIMETVTSNARPIMIGDENYLTWEQLAEVPSGEVPLEHLAQPVPTSWFMPR
jgi:ABC-type glycerol-3-phosphate transport system substrate-binding protein